MQELTFETILRLPQIELKKTLKAELISRGYPVTDKPGYLYAEGTVPVLLVAHMDRRGRGSSFRAAAATRFRRACRAESHPWRPCPNSGQPNQPPRRGRPRRGG